MNTWLMFTNSWGPFDWLSSHRCQTFLISLNVRTLPIDELTSMIFEHWPIYCIGVSLWSTLMKSSYIKNDRYPTRVGHSTGITQLISAFCCWRHCFKITLSQNILGVDVSTWSSADIRRRLAEFQPAARLGQFNNALYLQLCESIWFIGLFLP